MNREEIEKALDLLNGGDTDGFTKAIQDGVTSIIQDDELITAITGDVSFKQMIGGEPKEEEPKEE